MKTLKTLAAAVALLLLLTACSKDKTGDEAAASSSPAVSAAVTEALQPAEPQIPQTAGTRPASTDELYEKWMDLGVVDKDDRYGYVSNAELCVILNNILQYDRDGIHRYYDVLRQDSYYYDVMAIDSLGILTGSDGYFLPEEPITRERAIKAVAEAFQFTLPDAAATSYSDDADISDEARGACLLCDQNRWIAADKLRPQDKMTQAELLWLLDKLVNDVVSGGDLSGTYYSGVVITGGSVTITDATIYGGVYIIAGGGDVSLTVENSTITGSICIGCGIRRGSDAKPVVMIDSSHVGGIAVNYESTVTLNADADMVFIRRPVTMQMGDSAYIGYMLADSVTSITGAGKINLAVITTNAANSSFAAAPDTYLDANGGAYSGSERGFIKILDKTYLIQDDGSLCKGFVMVGDDEYYFDENGVMATGLQEIDGVAYKFGDDGVQISGFRHENGSVYYYDLEGNKLTGRSTIGENDYIFDDAGILQTGKFTFEGAVYASDDKGVLQKDGPVEIDGETYYAGEDGALLTGALEFDGEAHWFAPETYAMVKSTTVDDMIIDENGVITNYDGMPISSGSEELDGLLDEIVASVCTDDMTLDDKMWAVFSWTKTNIKYRATPIDLTSGYTQELVIEHGLNTVNTRRGACEHFAIVNALLFNRLGVKTILIQGQRHSLNNGDWAEHTWVLAKLEDKWYHFDALFEYTNTGVDRSAYKKLDSDMSVHHTWDAADYPVCDGVTEYPNE